jgi:hypothetical protein
VTQAPVARCSAGDQLRGSWHRVEKRVIGPLYLDGSVLDTTNMHHELSTESQSAPRFVLELDA